MAVGTELTFDYNFERYGDKPMRCYCGSPNCRKFIGGAQVRSGGGGGGRCLAPGAQQQCRGGGGGRLAMLRKGEEGGGTGCPRCCMHMQPQPPAGCAGPAGVAPRT